MTALKALDCKVYSALAHCTLFPDAIQDTSIVLSNEEPLHIVLTELGLGFRQNSRLTNWLRFNKKIVACQTAATSLPTNRLMPANSYSPTSSSYSLHALTFENILEASIS